MTKEQFLQLISGGLTTDIYSRLGVYSDAMRIKKYLNQINPAEHDVMRQLARPDKYIYKDSTETDENGEPKKGAIDRIVKVGRLPLAIQKRIVETAAAFLGIPELDATPAAGPQTDFLQLLKKVWEDNKIDWKFSEIAEETMKFTQCAELWYYRDAKPDYWTDEPINPISEESIQMRIIGTSYGDELYPIYDDYNDMIAFGRRFTTHTLSPTTAEKVDIINFELYTDDKIYTIEIGRGSTIAKVVDNPLGKIPIIYYKQKHVEWSDVQWLIERLETKISNHADVNDYFDSPIVVAKGKVKSFAEKGETGKFIEMEGDGDVKYLTWDMAPESAKLEMDNLNKWINQLTDTPDISFDALREMPEFSGKAMSFFFFAADQKAKRKEARVFGEPVQRRINLNKAMLVKLDPNLAEGAKVKVKAKFTFYLKQDVDEKLARIGIALQNKLISHETAVQDAGLTENSEAELLKIKAEDDAAFQRQQALKPPTPPNPKA